MQKAQSEQRPAIKVKALPKLKTLMTCQRPSNCH